MQSSIPFQEFGLLFIFILCVIYLLNKMSRKESFEYYPINNPNNPKAPAYAKYKYQCAYPCGYHRYGSNRCDPQQDELPITMPNPNSGVPPPQMTFEAEMLEGVKGGSVSTLGKINLCQ